MGDITFYHSERVDNARRTGLTVNGNRALEFFAPGDEERDPSLRWYVDVICYSDTPPTTQEAAAEWFEEHRGEIQSSLEDAAERLQSGIDMDTAPWSFEQPGESGPIRVSISAMRRYAAINIAQRLQEFLTNDWPRLSHALEPVS